MKLTESNSVNLDKPLAESAVEKTYCGAAIELRYGSTACGNDWHGERMQCRQCWRFDGNSGHVASGKSEGAVAPGECGSVPDGWKFAMRVLQSDLYRQLDDAEKAECDYLAGCNPMFPKNATPCQRADAVASRLNGNVPDELALFEAWYGKDSHFFVSSLNVAAQDLRQARWEAWQARAALGMQPPNNQPNSDHVAVIGAKPDSVNLAGPAETATDPRVDASDLNLLESCINWLDSRSETVWAKEYCYRSLMRAYAEGLNKIRADLQSGISPLDGRPNDQNSLGEEYSEWIRFYDAGNGSFGDFLKQKLAQQEGKQ